MVPSRGRIAFLFGLLGAGSVVAGCFLGEDVAQSEGEVKASKADPLESTLLLADGCTASKVGPNHLLVAARCVVDKDAFKVGATIKFTVAATVVKKDEGKKGSTDGGSEAGAVKPKTLTQALEASPEDIFTNELYPLVKDTCSGCHENGPGPVYFGADAKSSYPLFKGRGFDLKTGPYLTKGKHAGPALTDDQKAAAEKWIAAEAAAAAPAPAANADAGATHAAEAYGAGDADGGPPKPTKPANKSTKEATIAGVYVHPSYLAKCTDTDAGKGSAACDFGAIGASDARDLAVIVLDAELAKVPTIPVDLDAVADSDPLLAIASGCTKFDGTAGATLEVTTIAVPAKAANYRGSPYDAQPALSSRLRDAYVVTPGAGWANNTQQDKICKNDIGAPLFRPDVAAVAGVTSNFTSLGADSLVPVTVFHTKVDATSKVGTWLGRLGVTTTHSCGKKACAKHTYDGGLPVIESSGGATSEPDETPDAGHPDGSAPAGGKDAGAKKDAGPATGNGDDGADSDFPQPDSDFGSGDDESSSDDEDVDAGSTAKKKKAAASSCSAAPGSTTTTGAAGFGLLGIVLAAARIRRRRPRST